MSFTGLELLIICGFPLQSKGLYYIIVLTLFPVFDQRTVFIYMNILNLRKHTPKYLTVKGHDTCNLFSNGSEEKHTHTHMGGGGQRWRYYSKCGKMLIIGESEKSI